MAVKKQTEAETERQAKRTSEVQAELYLSIAAIFHRPNQEVSHHLEELIELWEEEFPLLMDEIAALKKFCQTYPPGEERLNTLWEHYIPLFETGNVEAPPYASVHLNPEGQVWGEETYKVQEFYRSQGYDLGKDADQLPDHLAVELEFLALLARDGKGEALEAFRQQHLLPFLRKILPLIEQSLRPVYFPVARILRTWQFFN